MPDSAFSSASASATLPAAAAGPRAYRTLQAPTRIEEVQRRSLFIGEAIPVRTEAEVRAALEAVKQREPTATHHCYAYVLGGAEGVYYQRHSDAGEPKGTAGRPILDAILGRGLTDLLVVVTRYFGGVLLGAGGLVRAYSSAALAALDAGVRLYCEEQPCWICTLPYAQAEAFRYAAERQGAAVLSETYGADVQFRLTAPTACTAALTALLQEKTAGRESPVPDGTDWIRRTDV